MTLLKNLICLFVDWLGSIRLRNEESSRFCEFSPFVKKFRFEEFMRLGEIGLFESELEAMSAERMSSFFSLLRVIGD